MEPCETLIDRIRRFQAERPSASALRDADGEMDWGALGTLSDRIAQALLAAGLGKGDRVAFLSAGSLRYAATMVGALKAGLSVVPLPTLLAPATIAGMIDDSGAKLLFLSDAMRPVADGADVHRIGFDFAADGIPDLDGFIADAPATPPAVTVGLEDEFNVIYSSGTTGRPKGIVQTHRLRAGAALTFGAVGFPDGGRTLATTALYSNWTMGALIYTLWAGGCIHIGGKFSAAAMLDLCDSFRPHDIFMVPVQVSRLLDHAAATGRAAPSAALKWCAGSFFQAAHKRALLDWWPGGLMEIYGLTEGAPFTMLAAHRHPDKLGTVGRSNPPEDLKIIDEQGHVLPPGERGEVLGRVRIVMRGYHNNPAATEALVWRDAAGQPWFRSGDIGMLDGDGFLTITGRKKDMIISGGFNIYAVDLEAVLLAHADVAEAVAFPVPSREWGESPVAAVVARAGGAIDADALRVWANARLGALQRLRAVVVLDELPRGSLDKVLHRELRDRFRHLGDTEGDPAS